MRIRRWNLLITIAKQIKKLTEFIMFVISYFMIKVYSPSPVLADYINCFWSLENLSGEHTELVYPTGKIQLIFHYRKPFTDTGPEGISHTQPQFALCGQKISYSNIKASDNSGMIAAVLKPHSPSAFFKMPLCEITGYTVSFSDIFRDWKNSEGEFNDCADDISRIKLISSFLLKKIGSTPTCHDYFVRSCVDEILNNRGTSAPFYSMEKFGYSERSLQRIFRKSVGLSPKSYAEIVRFENSISLFRQGKNMTGICHESGYYDQSHFIRSFRKFTGLTPSEFQNLV